MFKKMATFTLHNWWIPDVIDLIAFLILAVSALMGIYLRKTIGEVSFERDATKQMVRIIDERFAGEWFIWREGASISERYLSVILLILGVFILWMALMAWMKTYHFHGSFQFSQRAKTIQQILIGITLVWVGVLSSFNRVYTYRWYLRRGRIRMKIGVRVPVK